MYNLKILFLYSELLFSQPCRLYHSAEKYSIRNLTNPNIIYFLTYNELNVI